MATFLSLTNELLRRIGEVTLDSTEFSGARNIQALAKNSINSSVREILHIGQEFPFTLTSYIQTLSSGTNTYSFPADTSNVDWDSFYLKKFGDTVNAEKLEVISYPVYLERHRPRDDNAGADGYGVPVYVFQTQDLKFGVSPIPNDSYEIEYRYWSFPSDMSVYDDTCIIPDRFTNVLVDGAMVYMMIYRSNEQSASVHKQKFDEGIRSMRRILLDDPTTMTSTVLNKTGIFSRVL